MRGQKVIKRMRYASECSDTDSSVPKVAEVVDLAHGTSTKAADSAQQRVSEFPDQSLPVSSGKLYYQACSTVLSKKNSVVSNHITTHSHKEMKLARAQQLERQFLLMHNEVVELVGGIETTLPAIPSCTANSSSPGVITHCTPASTGCH